VVFRKNGIAVLTTVLEDGDLADGGGTDGLAPPPAPPQADAASPCIVDVAPGDVPLPALGGSASVQVSTSRPGCPWRLVGEPVDWLSITGPSSGDDSATVGILARANPGPTDRNATLEVAG